MLLCTVAELTEDGPDGIDAALIDRIYAEEGDEVVDSNKINPVTFYTNDFTLPASTHNTYMFMQRDLSMRIKTMLTQNNNKINKFWILIDNQSTIDLFHNKDLLSNIREVNDHVVVHCNVGKVVVNMMGDLPGYGPVWYYPDGIADILSLYVVSLRFHI